MEKISNGVNRLSKESERTTKTALGKEQVEGETNRNIIKRKQNDEKKNKKCWKER